MPKGEIHQLFYYLIRVENSICLSKTRVNSRVFNLCESNVLQKIKTNNTNTRIESERQDKKKVKRLHKAKWLVWSLPSVYFSKINRNYIYKRPIVVVVLSRRPEQRDQNVCVLYSSLWCVCELCSSSSSSNRNTCSSKQSSIFPTNIIAK